MTTLGLLPGPTGPASNDHPDNQGGVALGIVVRCAYGDPMTEPPRPPTGGEPGLPGPGPDDPTTPLPGASGPGSFPPPGSYPPPGGTPPPGGYPPGAAGYPFGGGYGPPGGYVNSEDRMWVLGAHLGGALGALISFGMLGFVAPLVAYLARGNQSPTVRAHAQAALNFQIVWSLIAFVLLFVGWCLLFLPNLAVVVIQIVFGVIATLRANDGRQYRYPMSASLIK
ncbi:DUF4870 domain-containing protein [Salinispora arenicola]|uniref:DUF4870 domain-containing protein n=1 Tax=Salinispora arenicola TaxID=168697 RepID=UPI0027DB2F39|nr:DUF4870 domain-containing protein [Salinispora arenicola]